MEALTLAGDGDGDGEGLLSSVPAEVNGGDPLLHPPPPPESPPLASTLRVALQPDAAFSLFDPSEDGGYDASDSPPSPRVHDAPSRAGRSLASECFKISVSDPQKEQEVGSSIVPGSGSFVSYLITTRIVGGHSELRVRRRFKDVVALADRLAEAYRGYFIPQRPDKSVVEGQVMQKQEFVEQRRSAIEKYLNRLATHPVIGRSNEFRIFLRLPGNSPLPVSTEAASRSGGMGTLPNRVFGEAGGSAGMVTQSTGQPPKWGRDFMKIFRELKHSVTNDWGGAKPLVVEEDKEFLERKVKVQDLEQQLTTSSRQAEVLVKAQQDIGDTLGQLGLTFVKLAKFETENATYLSQRRRASEIKQFSTALLRISRFYRESNGHTVKHLDILHEYLGLMLAVHSAFSDRSTALLTVQTLTTDLSSLHARREKLEASSIQSGDKSKLQRIDELKETIRITEDAKVCAIKEYECIKENNRSELERLDRERREDFLLMLKGFVSNQVIYAEKMTNVWANVAEETKGYYTSQDK
ncbi:sorting nexin 2A-like [Curcuma longa]|uniref:sorting nexin 2A-like n=1 Tax=Curcuma longa TaxID=136217 RepID=UPI003D9EF331